MIRRNSRRGGGGLIPNCEVKGGWVGGVGVGVGGAYLELEGVRFVGLCPLDEGRLDPRFEPPHGRALRADLVRVGQQLKPRVILKFVCLVSYVCKTKMPVRYGKNGSVTCGKNRLVIAKVLELGVFEKKCR